MRDHSMVEYELEELAESNPRRASDQARDLVAADPADERAAKLLARLVGRRGAVSSSPSDRRAPPAEAVAQAGSLIASGEFEGAERLLRQHLQTHPNDPPATHFMAEIAARCGFIEDAERILRQSAALHSNSPDIMTELGQTLFRIACARDLPQFVAEALFALDHAISLESSHERALQSKAEILMQVRQLDAAEQAYSAIVEAHPDCAANWANLAYLLKTIGQFGRAVAAYRTAIALDPCEGRAWWGLADLKLAKFFNEDIERMEATLADEGLSDEARIDISMALSKALEDEGNFERAAQYLLRGNSLRNEMHPFNADQTTAEIDLVTQIFTSDFVHHLAGWGDTREGPIFILGMPRSGSTLIEQILASHSAIEGTEELPIILQIAGQLAHGHGGRQPEEVFATLDQSHVRALGSRYLDVAQRARLTQRPFFTDKHPSNWRYLGLILAILPNAKIIDMRRNPMDCCFANYAQHFSAGADFTYDQRTLGRYYSDYVRLMRHFDDVLPGRIHRVIYDDLLEDIEGEVRRLLDYLALPFEENCLEFYKTERPVHTPSSEQVRQPINRAGVGRWRKFEPWLGGLKEALANVLIDWRR